MKLSITKRALPALAALAACAVVGSAVAQSAPPATITGNADAARDKNSMCIGCHGIPGYKASFPEVYHVPMIAGQNAKYIEAALKEYRRGQSNAAPSANIRKNAIMGAFAVQLSDKDIEDVAAYLSSLPGNLAVRK